MELNMSDELPDNDAGEVRKPLREYPGDVTVIKSLSDAHEIAGFIARTLSRKNLKILKRDGVHYLAVMTKNGKTSAIPQNILRDWYNSLRAGDESDQILRGRISDYAKYFADHPTDKEFFELRKTAKLLKAQAPGEPSLRFSSDYPVSYRTEFATPDLLATDPLRSQLLEQFASHQIEFCIKDIGFIRPNRQVFIILRPWKKSDKAFLVSNAVLQAWAASLTEEEAPFIPECYHAYLLNNNQNTSRPDFNCRNDLKFSGLYTIKEKEIKAITLFQASPQAGITSNGSNELPPTPIYQNAPIPEDKLQAAAQANNWDVSGQGYPRTVKSNAEPGVAVEQSEEQVEIPGVATPKKAKLAAEIAGLASDVVVCSNTANDVSSLVEAFHALVNNKKLPVIKSTVGYNQIVNQQNILDATERRYPGTSQKLLALLTFMKDSNPKAYDFYHNPSVPIASPGLGASGG